MTNNIQVSTELAEKIRLWDEAKTNTAAWKVVEQAHRGEILKLLFDESKSGTQKAILPDGRVLKANIVHKKEMASYAEVVEVLKNVSAPGYAAVRWKAELAGVAYKGLSQEDRAWIDTVVTTKPGSHSMEIV